MQRTTKSHTKNLGSTRDHSKMSDPRGINDHDSDGMLCLSIDATDHEISLDFTDHIRKSQPFPVKNIHIKAKSSL